MLSAGRPTWSGSRDPAGVWRFRLRSVLGRTTRLHRRVGYLLRCSLLNAVRPIACPTNLKELPRGRSVAGLCSFAMRTHKPAFAVVAAMAAALVLVGCGDNGPRAEAAASAGPPSVTGPSQTSSFNEADVMFAQQMIPHHQQAIQMAQMAPSHAQSPKVRQLAARIGAAQAQEIKTMTSWLHAWGKPVPSGTPGMMSQQEMSQLMAAHGAQFDRLFLQMMIRHHEGAVEMAKTEQARGLNPAAKKLAHKIETSQTAEIAQMQQMPEQ